MAHSRYRHNDGLVVIEKLDIVQEGEAAQGATPIKTESCDGYRGRSAAIICLLNLLKCCYLENV